MYPLNLGRFCSALDNALPDRMWKPFGSIEKDGKNKSHNHRDIVTAVLLLPYNDEVLEELDQTIYEVSDRDASKYFNNQGRVKKQIRTYARSVGLDVIQSNFETRILRNVSQQGQQFLLEDLKALVRKLPQDEDHAGLRDYLSLFHSGTEDYSPLYSRFMAKCAQFCLFMPNTPGERSSLAWLNQAPVVSHRGDPYRLVSDDIGSSAVTIHFQDLRSFQRPKDYCCFDLLAERIRRQSLIIKNVNCSTGVIQVSYDHFPENGYTLRRLKLKEANTAKKFIQEHETEFHDKRSWEGVHIGDMAFDGLLTEKWTAYGYFDPNGNLIGYLDAKIRVDGGVELGILLTDNQYRGMQLASSLIYFFKFLFPHSRLFGGTYEENTAMRKTFKTTNFNQILYYDRHTGRMTSTIRERIDKKHPEDRNKDTNSVYYFSESLMTEVFRATLKKNAKKCPNDKENLPDANNNAG